MTVVKKNFFGAELLTDKEDGYVKAVISTFGIIDRDGDAVMAGAIPDNVEVRLCSWGHKWDNLPVGKGTIKCTPTQAVFEGRFFLDTEAGMETYKTVKNMGSLQEWSWGFQVTEQEPGVIDGKKCRMIKKTVPFEVSPVLIGANPQTATVDIKSVEVDVQVLETDPEKIKEIADCVSEALQEAFEEKASEETISVEETEVTNTDTSESKDYAEMIGQEEMPMSMPDSGMAKTGVECLCCAKDDIKALLIAELQDDAGLGPISDLMDALRALTWFEHYKKWEAVEDMMEMRGAKPELFEEKQTRFTKFVKEMTELGFVVENIENQAEFSDDGVKYSQQGEALLANATSFIERSKSLADLRVKEGRVFSEANRKRLASLKEALLSTASQIEELLSNTERVVEEINSEKEVSDEVTETKSEDEITEETTETVSVPSGKSLADADRLLRLAQLKMRLSN